MKRILAVIIFIVLFLFLVSCTDEFVYWRIQEGIYQTDTDKPSTYFNLSRAGDVLTVVISQKDTTIKKDTLISYGHNEDFFDAEFSKSQGDGTATYKLESFTFDLTGENKKIVINGDSVFTNIEVIHALTIQDQCCMYLDENANDTIFRLLKMDEI